jgi:hypothetical protein
VTSYSVITLNYDRVLESVEDYMRTAYVDFGSGGFHRPCASEAPEGHTLLAKLHGDLSPDEIVPPTWAKGKHEHIKPDWEAAHSALSRANYIRILGYSLPQTDSYVRFLLKSAIAPDTHLKRVDVVCRDKSGTVHERYREFVDPQRLRFVSKDIAEYLRCLKSAKSSFLTAPGHPDVDRRAFEAHERFMVE